MDDEKLIYDEGQEVAEMYFVIEGFIGIGFALVTSGIAGRTNIISKK